MPFNWLTDFPFNGIQLHCSNNSALLQKNDVKISYALQLSVTTVHALKVEILQLELQYIVYMCISHVCKMKNVFILVHIS